MHILSISNTTGLFDAIRTDIFFLEKRYSYVPGSYKNLFSGRGFAQDHAPDLSFFLFLAAK